MRGTPSRPSTTPSELETTCLRAKCVQISPVRALHEAAYPFRGPFDGRQPGLQYAQTAAGARSAAPPPPPVAVVKTPTVPLFSGLGKHSRKVTTTSPDAQRYFDQGLAFVYGFNHDEAIRSFSQAAEIDPQCAMAHWGVALANGPHINNPAVDEAHAKAAWEALSRAREFVRQSAPAERALIDALAARHAMPQPADRKPLDQAYADAMKQVRQAYPDDADVAALYAEALMDLRPWDFWKSDGSAQPGTNEIVAHPRAGSRQEPVPPARQPPLHPRRRSLAPARKGRSRRQSAARSVSPGSATWCTCHRTSTCVAGAGKRRRSPTRKRSPPTRSTGKRFRGRTSTGSTWRTIATCSLLRP